MSRDGSGRQLKVSYRSSEMMANRLGLPEGSMIKRPDLHLVDAMNSIEMLEPRMDTGVCRPDAKDFTFDPQKNLDPEELCWVMDEMLALEVCHIRRPIRWTMANGRS